MFQTVINAFQSTPPRGGRPVPLGPVIAITDISIHAPARGATVGIAMLPPKATHFNPRPREGGDCSSHRLHQTHPSFQSTPPRGGRLVLAQRWVVRADISIHAPARGATAGRRHILGLSDHFNPRPREGGDVIFDITSESWIAFQSTPPRGGRLSWDATRSFPTIFQSTPPRGGRLLPARDGQA